MLKIVIDALLSNLITVTHPILQDGCVIVYEARTSRIIIAAIHVFSLNQPPEEEALTDKNPSDGTVDTGEVAGGLYAVLEIKNLFSITDGWKTLNEWIQTNRHEPVGVKKGSHGWVSSAYEELLDWRQQKPPEQWRFKLWMQLQE